ncbi:hypothetical protein FRC06_002159 [Ceratobasidium sp. 370]|nr:hypothetical protein FRC06_002159 [Ceratobasidium sp. 370]
MEHLRDPDERLMVLARGVIDAFIPPALLELRQRPLAPAPNRHDPAARDAWLQQLLDEDEEDELRDYGEHGAPRILPFLRYVPDLERLRDAYNNFMQHVIGEDPDVNEPDVGPPRPFNVRQPYRITMMNRQTDWFEKSFAFEERWFRGIYRMSKATFRRVEGVLEANPSFRSRSNRPQRPVKHQLAVFLIRYGTRGSSTMEPVVKMGVGHGTVVLYCRRVTRALRELGQEVVAWPNEQRKREIKDGFGRKFGLDGVIGIVDGSLIELTRKPTIGGDAYLSRKKTVSVNVQIIVDHIGRIISYEMGWPGSKNDCFIWLNSYLWRHRQQFFQPGEFLLGDKGYPCSQYILRPYADDELDNDAARRRRFNKRLSRVRVHVECAIGKLKARFPCLNMMGTPENIKDLYRTIQALMVIHNLCVDFHDTVDGLPDEYTRNRLNGQDTDDSDEDIRERRGHVDVGDLNDDDLADAHENVLAAGREFRLQCVDLLYPR